MFWRAMYKSGSVVRKGINDYIEYYFNELDYKIYIIYLDEKHKEVKEYRAEYPDEKIIGTYKEMREAQLKISDILKGYYNRA